MGDKFFTEVTARNLGYAPAVINQENLKEFDEKLRSLKKKQLRLIKNKPDGWRELLEETNVKGMRVAAESGGYKTFETIDPYTLKKYEYGVDLKKTIDPMDLTEGASLKEINKSQKLKDLIELNRPMSIELQKQANKMLQSADKLTSREQLALCSLLSRGGLPGDCTAAIKNDPVKAAQIFDEAPITSKGMEKVKSAATGFLGVLKRGGKFGAMAAVGAGAAAIVKPFMNDDVSTYLSDEGQQKNMLKSMILDPITQPDEKITEDEVNVFDKSYLPTLGAVTAAGAIPGGKRLFDVRKRMGAGNIRAALSPIRGVLGKGLAATGTPLGIAALEPLYLASQISEGDSLGEIATNPLNYLAPAFAGGLSREATRFVGPTASKVMRLGISPTALKTFSRRFGLPGLALSSGISGFEMLQNYRAGRGLFDDG